MARKREKRRGHQVAHPSASGYLPDPASTDTDAALDSGGAGAEDEDLTASALDMLSRA